MEYIRVSSKDQNEARQIEEMKKHGVDSDLFLSIKKAEKILTGKNTN